MIRIEATGTDGKTVTASFKYEAMFKRGNDGNWSPNKMIGQDPKLPKVWNAP